LLPGKPAKRLVKLCKKIS